MSGPATHILRVVFTASLTSALLPTTGLSQAGEGDKWWSTNGPPSGNVVSILELDDGMVLAGTEGKGLFFRGEDDELWTNVPYGVFNEDQVRALASYDGALLAGTGRSGIYRSVDGGLSWELFKDGLKSFLIYDFLVSGQNDLYVATGKGIHRLSDSDQWVDLGGPVVLDVRTIVETDDGDILIGTFNFGKLLTSDSGSSWEQVDTVGPVRSLAIGPNGEIVAGIWGLPTIQRSDDNGRSWVPVANGLEASRLWSVAIDHSGVIYTGSVQRGISHSVDGGATWRRSSAPGATVTNLSVAPDGHVLAATSWGAFRSNDHGQSWTVEGIPLSRVRGLYSTGSRILAGNDAGGIYYSDDWGATWVRTNAETNAVYEIDRKNDGALYAATRGSVYRSDDEGTTWASVWKTFLWVYSTTVDSRGTVFAGTESGIYRSGPDGTWTIVSPPGQKVFSLVVDSEDIVYAGIEHEGMLRSTDGGTTWERVALQFWVTNECLCSILTMSDGQLAAAPLLTGGVWLSADRGETWAATPGDGVSESVITDLSMSTHGELAAGELTGNVFVFDSSTNEWKRMKESAPDNIRSVSLVRTEPDTVIFVGTETAGVYRRPATVAVAAEHPLSGSSFSLSVYPNPATDQATVDFSIDLPGEIVIQLVDPLGRIVTTRRLFSVPGRQRLRIDTGKVPSGLYQIRARHASGWSGARAIVVVH